ncbi:carbohydrate binding domain-containing protein [Streptomyces chartreusis]|uniref:phage head spike fiber domain-containing protein n=1 Tax=Streptomyces chartreusis TaxID=1969 RepID=UPI00371E004D
MTLTIEAGFGWAPTSPTITWTDITQWVDLRQQIRISRGASDELSQTQAGTLGLTLDNTDGRFTPGNTASPYSPYVRPSCPIRISRTVGGKNLLPNPSFETGVADWTPSATPTRAVSTTHVYDGTQSMLITWGGVAGQTVTSAAVSGLVVGEVYTFSAYVWVPAGDATVQLSLAGGSAGAASTLNDQFERISCTFTATTTSHQVRVRSVGTPTAGDQVWVDACQIEQGSAATVFDSTVAQTYYRFYGLVTDWNQGWTGLQDRVRVGAVDLFGLLSGDEQLQALIVEEILQVSPLAYYPLSEPSSATSAGDIAGAGAGSLAITQAGAGGTLEFGEGTGPGADGLSTPLFTPSSATAGKYLSGDLGQNFADAASDYYMFMECWFSTTTSGRVLFSLRSQSNQFQIIFSLESGTGKLRIQWTTIGGPLAGFGSSVAATPNLADGEQHFILYDEQAGEVYIDDDPTGYSVAVDGMYELRHLTVGAYANDRLWSGTISHLALHAPATPWAASITGRYDAGMNGFAGEDSDVRVLRLAAYAGIHSLLPSGVFSAVASQGEGGKTALEMMREVEATEGGKLATDREAASLIFQARSVRYNATSALSLAYADLETDDVQSTVDTQKLVNTVTGSRPGGATQRIANVSSRVAYGPKRRELNLLKMTDGEVLDAAWWLISRYADPPPEIRQIPVEAYTLPDATVQALLAADISTVFTITSLPATAPAPTATATVEGYVETIGQSSHRINFHTSRTNTDSVWVLGNSTYSALGSTTRLAY